MIVAYLKNNKRVFTFANLIVFLLALGLLISPFVKDLTMSVLGWEIPKVHFWQKHSIFLIILILLNKLFSWYKQNLPKIKINKWFFIGVLVLGLSTLVVGGEFSFWGNKFREQGLYTIGLLFLVIWLIKDYVSRQNIHFILLAFILSSMGQIWLAWFQYQDLYQHNPATLKLGLYIYGSFGQSNFYVGRLLIGLLMALYYLRTKLRWLALLVVIGLLGGIYISFATWGQMLAILILLITAGYEWVWFKGQRLLIIGVLIIMIIGIIPITLYLQNIGSPLLKNAGIGYRAAIWQSIYKVYWQRALQKGDLLLPIYGSGWDTLGNLLQKNRLLVNDLVDRAHNIFLDIFASIGLLGLGMFLVTLKHVVDNFKQHLDNRLYGYIVLAIFIWLLRSSVHTSSIINIVDFMVLIMLAMVPQKLKSDFPTG